jgi:DNA invertase Pin-like site-specific DNA recombinase
MNGATASRREHFREGDGASFGWRLVPDRFDDGAFSGASLDRPALQDLLEQVRSQKIDIVVVCKVDRLTRETSCWSKSSTSLAKSASDRSFQSPSPSTPPRVWGV